MEFHWLRPYWLLALVALLPFFVLLWRQRAQQYSPWEEHVDSELMPYVFESVGRDSNRIALLSLLLFWVIATVVLAGPVWVKKETPLYRSADSVVMVLDLSRSMEANDIQPSRLERARFKLHDLLDRLQGYQVGLVVFSAVPYVISPLTDDVATVQAFVPSLTTSVVPVQGGNTDAAIVRASDLLGESHSAAGNILLITDSPVGDDTIEWMADYHQRTNGRLSVLGVGTEAGTPIKDDRGRFIKTADGTVVIARLDREGLSALAQAGGGTYAELSADDHDLDTLVDALKKSGTRSENFNSEGAPVHVQWMEYAPNLLPLCLLILLLVFRRGVL